MALSSRLIMGVGTGLLQPFLLAPRQLPASRNLVHSTKDNKVHLYTYGKKHKLLSLGWLFLPTEVFSRLVMPVFLCIYLILKLGQARSDFGCTFTLGGIIHTHKETSRAQWAYVVPQLFFNCSPLLYLWTILSFVSVVNHTHTWNAKEFVPRDFHGLHP